MCWIRIHFLTVIFRVKRPPLTNVLIRPCWHKSRGRRVLMMASRCCNPLHPLSLQPSHRNTFDTTHAIHRHLFCSGGARKCQWVRAGRENIWPPLAVPQPATRRLFTPLIRKNFEIKIFKGFSFIYFFGCRLGYNGRREETHPLRGGQKLPIFLSPGETEGSSYCWINIHPLRSTYTELIIKQKVYILAKLQINK